MGSTELEDVDEDVDVEDEEEEVGEDIVEGREDDDDEAEAPISGLYPFLTPKCTLSYPFFFRR